MNDLLKKMLGAHGGLERWQTIRKISADFSPREGLNKADSRARAAHQVGA